MKKQTLLAFLLMGLTTVSQGSAILWTIDSAAIRDFTVSGETITEETSKFISGANLYFFLGTTTTEDVEKAFSGTEFNTSALSTYLESTVSNQAGGKAKGTTPVIHDQISSSSANSFFCVISTIKDGTAYYKLVTGEAVGYETTGDPLPPTTSVTFTRNAVQSSSWSAVPEPSVALMGLLGIGMLIKRRRA